MKHQFLSKWNYFSVLNHCLFKNVQSFEHLVEKSFQIVSPLLEINYETMIYIYL